MSHAQYTAIARTRLTDIKSLPAGELMQFLATRSEWFREQVIATMLKPSS